MLAAWSKRHFGSLACLSDWNVWLFVPNCSLYVPFHSALKKAWLPLPELPQHQTQQHSYKYLGSACMKCSNASSLSQGKDKIVFLFYYRYFRTPICGYLGSPFCRCIQLGKWVTEKPWGRRRHFFVSFITREPRQLPNVSVWFTSATEQIQSTTPKLRTRLWMALMCLITGCYILVSLLRYIHSLNTSLRGLYSNNQHYSLKMKQHKHLSLMRILCKWISRINHFNLLNEPSPRWSSVTPRRRYLFCNLSYLTSAFCGDNSEPH